MIQVALKISTLICQNHGPNLISKDILNQVLLLIQSPLLQGLALEQTIEFFISLVKHKQPGLQYQDLVMVIFRKKFNKFFNFFFKMLIKPIRDQSISAQPTNGHGVYESSNLAVHKQAFYSIAKCIAALTVTNQEEGQLVIKKFIQDIKDSKSRDSVRLLALLCLGETGKYM